MVLIYLIVTAKICLIIFTKYEYKKLHSSVINLFFFIYVQHCLITDNVYLSKNIVIYRQLLYYKKRKLVSKTTALVKKYIRQRN